MMKQVTIILLIVLSYHRYGHAQSYRYLLNPKVIAVDTICPSGSMTLNARHTRLPFFCRIEKMADMKSDIKFRFRLGDIPYVDQLEQKSTRPVFRQ